SRSPAVSPNVVAAIFIAQNAAVMRGSFVPIEVLPGRASILRETMLTRVSMWQRVDPVGELLRAGLVDLVADERRHLVLAAAVRQEPEQALVVSAGRDAQRVRELLLDRS